MGARREKGDGDGTIAAVDGNNVTMFATGFDDPKGIVFTGDWLITADFDRVWAVDSAGRKKLLAGPDLFPTPPPFLNDVTVERAGQAVLVTDMGARDRMLEAPGKLWPLDSDAARSLPILGRVYRVTLDGRVSVAIDHAREIAVPNGITVGPDGCLYVVDTFFGTVCSWREGVWRRIGDDFRGADGIVHDGTGHLYVSEAFSGRVWRVRVADGHRELLATLRSAADLILDASRRQLVIPNTRAGELAFLPLPD
jgi:sugar lactone lactonase YvrE